MSYNETQNTLDFLNAIYQNTSTALQSINDILPKIKNDLLKDELNREYKAYKQIYKDCEKFAKDNRLEIKDNNWFEKARLWTGINFGSLSDNSTRHLAEMLVLGTVMGVLTSYKDAYDYMGVNETLEKLCDQLLSLENENYSKLKTYLNAT